MTPEQVGRSSFTIPHRTAGCVGIALLVAVLFVWAGPSQAWLHPELLGTAVYVWNSPETDTVGDVFRKVFDWKAFDPNVNRVRPLNDVFEVIDAFARPYTTMLWGPRPALLPSSVLTAFIVPLLAYGFLRRITGDRLVAMLLCAILVSSTAFLSDVVVYIRPAKKLALLLLCVALYSGFRATRNNKGYIVMIVAVLASLFTDESALASFVICGLLFWRLILLDTPSWFRYAYGALPIVFLSVSQFVLPEMYLRFSVHGAWNALADAKKYEVFAYLLDYDFYRVSALQTARSLLSVVGVRQHVPWTEALSLAAIVAVPTIAVLQDKSTRFLTIVTNQLVLATIVFVGTSMFLTLLDWYPFPHEISYLGSFNFYYHSIIVIPVVLWLGFTAKHYALSAPQHGLVSQNMRLVAIVCLAAVVVTANVRLFRDVNNAARSMHLYPFSQEQIARALRIAHEAPRSMPARICLWGDASGARTRVVAYLKELYGDRWMRNGFIETFDLVSGHPIMTDEHVAHLGPTYFPFHRVTFVARSTSADASTEGDATSRDRRGSVEPCLAA